MCSIAAGKIKPLQNINESSKCGVHSKEQINLPMAAYTVIENAYRGPSMLIYNMLENIGLSS